MPGAVALLARGENVTVEAVGTHTVEGGIPMARDSIFRIASLTKPITAAAVMLLVDERRLRLDDPVERWLPELAAPVVVRTPQSPLDDVVPARRPITVFDLLTNRAGYGWPSDFSLPQVQALSTVQTDGREVQRRPRARRVAGRLGPHPAALPARRSVAVRHVLGPAGHPRRAGERAAVARVLRRAHLRAAGHARHRLRRDRP